MSRVLFLLSMLFQMIGSTLGYQKTPAANPPMLGTPIRAEGTPVTQYSGRPFGGEGTPVPPKPGGSGWGKATPFPRENLGLETSGTKVPASPDICSSDPIISSAGSSLQILPAVVEVGQEISYCIQVTPGDKDIIAPEVTMHLPKGAVFTHASGAGWMCEAVAGGQGEVFCRSMLMVGGRYPKVIGVFASAPDVPGKIQACVELKYKDHVDKKCESSEVVNH